MISKYCCGEDVQEIGLSPFQTRSQNLHTQPTPYYKELRVQIPGRIWKRNLRHTKWTSIFG